MLLAALPTPGSAASVCALRCWEDTTSHWMILQGSYIYGAIAICIALTLVGGYAVRTLASRISTAHDAEERFRTLAEAIPEIVWTAVPEGAMDYANQRLAELTGMRP